LRQLCIALRGKTALKFVLSHFTCMIMLTTRIGKTMPRKTGLAKAMVMTVDSSDVIEINHNWTSSGSAPSAVSRSVLK